MPLSRAVNWEAVSAALGGEAGANANYVFKADGLGGGEMVPNTQTIPNRVTVGTGGDVDYTSIADAVAYAIAQGASATVPWEVVVYPGSYTESPFTMQPGVTLRAETTRLDTVYLTASNPNADFITFDGGGSVTGFHLSGVTDPVKALLRVDGATTLAVLHGVAVRGCSNGLVVSGGAKCVATYFTILVENVGQGVTTGAQVTGSGSYLGLVSAFLSVPADILPFYASNPVQTAISVNSSAELYMVGSSARITPADSTASVIRADGGAKVNLMASEISDSGNALHIGSSGSGTIISANAVALKNNVKNFKSDSATGKFYTGAVSVDVPGVDLTTGATLTGLIQYRNDGIARLNGNGWRYTFNNGSDVNLADFFSDFISTGVSNGGEVTAASGLNVDVAAGDGFVVRGAPDDDAAHYEWADVTNLALTASATNYVYYDSVNKQIEASTSPTSNLEILLATVVTDGSGIRYLHDTRLILTYPAQALHNYLLDNHKVNYKSGLAVIQGTTVRKLDVGSGSYYLALNVISYAGSGGDATWSYFYGTNGATEVASQTLLDITNYDNAGTLTAMTAGYYRKDTLYLTSDGRLNLIYGTAEHATKAAAEAEGLGNAPTFIEPSGCPLAKVVVQQGTGIASLVDARPVWGSGGSGSGGVTVHAALAGLSADDHTQYLLVSGARAMSGDLDMGANDINNVGTVDGVDVSAHASRHNPGGADALATGTPVAVQVGVSPSAGSAASYAVSDHQHGVAAGSPVAIGTANADGTASTVARSDHVHAHGDLPGGSLHSTAVASVSAGFISASDQAKLDGIASGATNTPLSNTAPINVTKAAASAGVASAAARQDHKHDIDTATAAALAVGNSAAEGASSSLARADHVHAVPRGTPVSVGTANAAGVSTDFAAADHVHSGLTRGAGDFATFATKASPVNNDIALIEDSAAAGAKKQITLGSVVALALTASAPADVTKATASVGVGTTAARSDHKHNILTAAAVAVGTANAEGTATSLARSDHTHQVTGLTITGQAQGDILYFNGTSWVRLPAGVAGQILQTGGAGANPSWVNASSVGTITYNQATATTTTTTTSPTDVLMSGMTLTPPAGTYLVWFSGDWANTNNGNTGTMSIYAGGTQVLASEVPSYRTSAGAVANFSTHALVTVNGAQAIEGRWRTTGNTSTNTRRQLSYIKVA